jgi:Tfp pilus assembly protein PilW
MAAGSTLLEIVVAAGLASAALVSLVGVAATHVGAYQRTVRGVVASETLRLVLDVLARDVRRAGFDPAGIALVPVIDAAPGALALQADDDGDGGIDQRSEEVVRYVFQPERGVLRRIVGRQSMPLAEGLSADGFILTYVDGAGATLDPDRTGAVEPLAIRRIEVSLMVRDDVGRPLAGARTAVGLRNRPWSP